MNIHDGTKIYISYVTQTQTDPEEYEFKNVV